MPIPLLRIAALFERDGRVLRGDGGVEQADVGDIVVAEVLFQPREVLRFGFHGDDQVRRARRDLPQGADRIDAPAAESRPEFHEHERPVRTFVGVSLHGQQYVDPLEIVFVETRADPLGRSGRRRLIADETGVVHPPLDSADLVEYGVRAVPQRQPGKRVEDRVSIHGCNMHRSAPRHQTD
ncbi:MAG: hypothetical protein FJX19_11250 [Alphaproteobacteria bacterium]|nr:hypothetical protein [Alphaproteobacteria bacterium]